MRRRVGRLDSRASGEGGFTLIELTVATAILISVITAVLPLHVGAMRVVAVAKQRQQASQLANEVQEQLRALPYDVVVAGLSSGDVAGDPNIVSGRFRPTYDTSIDEKLQVSGSATQAPLNPHRVNLGPINRVTYSVSTYVSQVNGAAPLQYWTTVVITWTSPATKNQLKRYVSRSRLFSPYGCLSTSTHPFSGPCQPFLYGTAGTTPGSIAIRPSVQGQSIVPGLNAVSADLVLPQVDSDYQVEQIVRSGAKAQTGSAVVVKPDSTREAVGGVVSRAATDTDPGTTEQGDSTAPVAQSGSTSVVGSGSSTLVLTTTTGDSGRASSSTAAAAGGPCKDLTDTSLTTAQPCASGQAQARTGGGAAVLDLRAGTRDLGNVALGSSGPAAAPTRSFVTRFAAPGVSYCTGGATDCAVAVVQRSLGTTQSGGLPAASVAGDSVPLGWEGYLFKLSDYRDQVVAQTARNGELLAASSASVQAGTLRYWNGSAYVDLPMTSAVAGTRYQYSVTGSYATSGAPVVVRADLDLVIGARGRTPTTTTTNACSTPCTVSAKSDSPVNAVVTYTVSQGGLPITSFTVTTALGSALATSTYKAAPSA